MQPVAEIETVSMEAPFETYLLNKKDNLMSDYDDLHELIMLFKEQEHEDILEKIEQISLKGMDDFYSQSVRMLVAGMSHEMKSPLQTLMGSMEIIEELLSEDGEIERDTLLKCVEMASEARSRIDSIIKVMSLCGKELDDSNIQDINLEILLQQILSSIKYREEYKTAPIKLQARCFCEKLKEENFYTIPSFVYHIVTNIVSNSCNAISSSKVGQGIILVDINCNYESEEVFLDIIDNGPGIQESQFDKIFMPFYSHRLVKNSYGLGLFIARAMARKMGGDIFVKESEPGKTVVRVVLKNLEKGIL